MSIDDERESDPIDDEELCGLQAEEAEAAEGTAPLLDFGEESEDAGEAPQVFAEGVYNAETINDEVFEELRLPPDVTTEVQSAWAAFQRSAESEEFAAESLYSAMLDAAPGLQPMFKTPRAILALRLLRGIGAVVGGLQDPKSLKGTTEALGFRHLDYEVTAPRVALFRDAIVDVIGTELRPQFSDAARYGLRTTLNYVGGALIFVRRNYAARLRILSSSWAVANKRPVQVAKAEGEEESTAEDSHRAKAQQVQGRTAEARKAEGSHNEAQKRNRDRSGISVPTTFPEMFKFNAAVMGFGESAWMDEVLNAFDAIVRNVASSHRLQEECDVVSLRLSKHSEPVDLDMFKAVMLAALRSLVPKGWDSDHEVAWSWLWNNVDRMLRLQMGRPARQELALGRLMNSIGDEERTSYCTEVYRCFFEMAPAGMDHFKQSTTRLLYVADKVFSMTLEMYREPDDLVNRLSALGLRHVGYGIPPELCGPYVCSCVSALRRMQGDGDALEAFEWSLSLLSRILARVINEGSTLVMRAINANSGRQLGKAVALAPRSERAEWVLNITVGAQSISPLLWAIETGSFEAAGAIIADLLTIRADRDRYYYGVDPLFERHPDIVQRLCLEAPVLLPALLDGLIWRSRLTELGRRRVVYFLKHLVVREDGGFAQAIEWIAESQDAKIVCHPVVSHTIDLVWNRVAARAFLFRKTWLLLTAVVFMLSQAVLNSGLHDAPSDSLFVRMGIFACRCFIYMVSWPSLAMVHIRRGRADVRRQNFIRIFGLRLPGHLAEVNSIVSVALCIILFVMLTMCPIIHCLGTPPFPGTERVMFTERCPEGDMYLSSYAVFSMSGMLCYWALLADLAVFSNRICAFSLVFGHVVSEVGLFLLALGFVLISFATAAVTLKVSDEDFNTIPRAAQSLMQMFLGMASSEQYSHLTKFPLLFSCVVAFCFVTGVYMINLLVAQLACAYGAAYDDMIGWARLARGEVCVASMGSVSPLRWERFVESLHFGEPCEFGEGDVGMPGAVQMTEPANSNVTTVDTIRRFGGSTSPSAMWPEDDALRADDMDDRLEKIERLLKKMMQKCDMAGRRRNSSSAGQTSGMTGSSRSSGDDHSGQSAGSS